MKSRRKAREAVLQALYQCDTLDDWRSEAVEVYFLIYQHYENLEGAAKDNYDFAHRLLNGVRENLSQVDSQISAASTHWSISRMSRIDRNILRSATYEIGFLSDIPVSVTINEAIEIAKSYGSDDSPMFINGVLDNIAKSHKSADKVLSTVHVKDGKKLAVNQ